MVRTELGCRVRSGIQLSGRTLTRGMEADCTSDLQQPREVRRQEARRGTQANHRLITGKLSGAQCWPGGREVNERREGRRKAGASWEHQIPAGLGADRLSCRGFLLSLLIGLRMKSMLSLQRGGRRGGGMMGRDCGEVSGPPECRSKVSVVVWDKEPT